MAQRDRGPPAVQAAQPGRPPARFVPAYPPLGDRVVREPGLQQVAQPVATAAHPHRDRSGRAADLLGDLGVAAFLDVVRDERLAGRVGQQCQCAVEQLDQLFPLEHGVEVAGDGVGGPVRLGVRSRQRAPSLRVQPAPADVAADRREPGVRSGRIGELVLVSPGLEQGFLGQVLRGDRVAHDRRAQAHETGTLPAGPQHSVERWPRGPPGCRRRSRALLQVSSMT